MTQYTREGAQDYVFENGGLLAPMNSEKAVAFTEKWIEMQHRAGPTSWTSYDYPNATGDLGDGKAMMVFDADSATYPKNKPGASAQAGNIGWYPGPAGPDGSYATNLWTWSLAMNSMSKNKHAAWLFMQWATGKEAMSKAVQGGIYADPVRKSVFDGVFKEQVADQEGTSRPSRPSSINRRFSSHRRRSSSTPPRTGRRHFRTSTAATTR